MLNMDSRRKILTVLVAVCIFISSFAGNFAFRVDAASNPKNILQTKNILIVNHYSYSRGHVPYAQISGLTMGGTIYVYNNLITVDNASQVNQLIGKARVNPLTSSATVALDNYMYAGISNNKGTCYVVYEHEYIDEYGATKLIREPYIEVSYPKTFEPKINLNIYEVNKSKPIEGAASGVYVDGVTADKIGSTYFKTKQLSNGSQIENGKYYTLEVAFNSIPAMSEFFTAIHYDTNVLSLAKVSTTKMLTDEIVDTSIGKYGVDKGEKVNYETTVNQDSAYNHGLAKGQAFNNLWYRRDMDKAGQYVNTVTGTIKNTLSSTVAVPIQNSVGQFEPSNYFPVWQQILDDTTWTKDRVLLRCFFKATGTPKTAEEEEANPTIKFATINDAPLEYQGLTDDEISMADMYCWSYPGLGIRESGYIVSAHGLNNILGPQFRIKNAKESNLMEEVPDFNFPARGTDFITSLGEIPYNESVGKLSTETRHMTTFSSVPGFDENGSSYALDYSVDNSSVPIMPKESILVYNFSNSGAGGIQIDDGKEDLLVINASKENSQFIKQGDKFYIYKNPTDTLPVIGPITPLGDGAIKINLSNTILNPNGGNLYIQIKNSDGIASAMQQIAYPKEVSRDVTFKYYRTKVTSPDDPPLSEGELEQETVLSEDGLASVKAGEQIELKVFFNNFNDLSGYNFPISFDPRIIKITDKTYTKSFPNGQLNSDEVLAGTSAIKTGTALSNITFEEWNIYLAKLSRAPEGSTPELEQTVYEQLAVEYSSSIKPFTANEIREIVEGVKRKLDYGHPEPDIPSVNWKGGFVFKDYEQGGERQIYPYLYNGDPNSGTGGQPLDNGILKVASAAMPSASINLNSKSEPYHFLSIYFIALKDGSPSIRLADSTKDKNFDTSSPNGGTVTLTGIEERVNYTQKSTERYQPYVEPPKDPPVITLNDGNALTTDIMYDAVNNPKAVPYDKTDQFVYYGSKLVDPGVLNVKTVDGTDITNSVTVKRELIIDNVTLNDGTTVINKTQDISAHAIDENLTYLSDWLKTPLYGTKFSIIPAKIKYSCQYNTLVSETYRDVFVIHQLGDVDRDGSVIGSDSDMLKFYFSGSHSIPEIESAPIDINYAYRVVDIDKDLSVLGSDADTLGFFFSGSATLSQDYQFII